jgi:ABC-type Fe3+/spermidine/putrescine transport system ATPase subunit
LDEPLSNLDAKLRVGMRAELSRIQKTLGITMIYVTHDQVEALSLSNEVVVMQAGKIEQIGTPQQIYRQPATPFVARFLGFDNHLVGTLEEVQPTLRVFRVGGKRFFIPKDPSAPWMPGTGGNSRTGHPSSLNQAIKEGASVEILFRPEDVRLEGTPSPDSLEVKVLFGTFLGKAVQYLVQFQDQDLTVICPEGHRFEEGQIAYLRLDPGTWFVLGKE